MGELVVLAVRGCQESRVTLGVHLTPLQASRLARSTRSTEVRALRIWILIFTRTLRRPNGGRTCLLHSAGVQTTDTYTYLQKCLPPFDALALWGTPLHLQECLAARISPALPVPASVARRLFLQHAAGLHWPLVSTAAAHAVGAAGCSPRSH